MTTYFKIMEIMEIWGGSLILNIYPIYFHKLWRRWYWPRPNDDKASADCDRLSGTLTCDDRSRSSVTQHESALLFIGRKHHKHAIMPEPADLDIRSIPLSASYPLCNFTWNLKISYESISRCINGYIKCIKSTYMYICAFLWNGINFLRVNSQL